jgi:hypothetical protein
MTLVVLLSAKMLKVIVLNVAESGILQSGIVALSSKKEKNVKGHNRR